jgi:ankyrin repeat protein
VHSLLDSGASPNAHLPRPWDYSWQDLTDNLSEEDYANGLKSPTLVLAAAAGNLNIVKLLLDRGAAVDATDLNGNTALMMASSTGNLQCVKLLLHKGANPNAQTTQKWGGMTPLMFAAHRGNAQVVLELINRGANVNLGDNDGFTPLMRAASESQVEVAKTLLSHGANVNARDNRLGRTPLMAAVFPGCGYGERQPDGEVVVAVGR